jgi:uncharacterized protein
MTQKVIALFKSKIMKDIVKYKWLKTFTNKSFRLIIFVTEQCNFRCVYCYEDFLLGKIYPEVVEGIKNLLSSRIHGIEVLQVSFFGGEPLMNKKAVVDIADFAKTLCAKNHVQFVGDITTNGYSLDEKTFNELIQVGVVSYQITIDGEKEIHDELRPTVNGKPTFDKIMKNLVMMSESDKEFYCTFRFNISDYNYNSVKCFLDKNYQYFENDKRFSFHFHPIFGMKELKLTSDDDVNKLQKLAEGFGLQKDEDDNEDHICYAARADSFVIRADGKVQKCTVALKDEINNVGKIFPDGTLNLDTEKLKKWIFSENKGCPLQSLALENLAIPYSEAGAYLNEVK